MSLRVLHLSTYAGGGGAGRAAAALNKALQKAGVDSRLVSAHGARFKAARAADRALWRLQRSPTETWRSPARFGSLSASEINASSADIVNLHWVTDGFMSIEEIGKIKKPILMSMYDMWAFCGSEHYGVDSANARWRAGYKRSNRPIDETGWDLDRNAWERKRQHWAPFHLVPASTWLARSTRQSALTAQWPQTQIPHPVNPDVFKPIDKTAARKRLGIDTKSPTVAFVASAGVNDRRKGFDLLVEAMRPMRREFPNVQVLLVGPTPHESQLPKDLKVVAVGVTHSDEELAATYTAADVLAVPSREDNLPLTAMEALMCGCPVVGFNVGGLPDIVSHNDSGYLAAPYFTEDLAMGIAAAIVTSLSTNEWSDHAQAKARTEWSSSTVAARYIELYREILGS